MPDVVPLHIYVLGKCEREELEMYVGFTDWEKTYMGDQGRSIASSGNVQCVC